MKIIIIGAHLNISTIVATSQIKDHDVIVVSQVNDLDGTAILSKQLIDYGSFLHNKLLLKSSNDYNIVDDDLLLDDYNDNQRFVEIKAGNVLKKVGKPKRNGGRIRDHPRKDHTIFRS